MGTKRKLPVGIQSFEKIRTEGYHYVDKTPFIFDTLRQAFLGKRELLQGLFFEKNRDWSVKHPVVYISFGAGVVRSVEEARETVVYLLRRHSQDWGIPLTEKLLNKRFEELIIKLCEKYDQKVVVLIDEYDKPILDNLHRPEVAAEIREELKNYHSVFKDAAPFLYFAALGLDVRVEEATNHRRLDMSVELEGRCFFFEFKVLEEDPEGRAFSQLKEKGYHERYLGACREVWLSGVGFSKKERNLMAFEAERVN